MKALIIEGKEQLIDIEENKEPIDKYIFLNSEGQGSHLLEVTVELESDSSKRVLIVADFKSYLFIYFIVIC